MAAAIQTILTIKDLYEIGKDVHDRCQAVGDDFQEGRERLSERLKVITANLKSYEALETAGKIRFQEEWSSDLTPVGTAAYYVRQHLKAADLFLGEFARRKSLDKFLNKSDIELRFNTLSDDLRDAAAALSNAVQPLFISGGGLPKLSIPSKGLASQTENKVIGRGTLGRELKAEQEQRGHVAIKEYYDQVQVVQQKQPTSPVAVVNLSDVKEIRNVGRGRYGRVFLAKHFDIGHVAVKEFYDHSSIKRVLREVKKMYEGLDCKYLVDIFGYIDDPKCVGIMMEFCSYGNLKEFNKKFMMTESLIMARKIRMILDIVEGMDYLHSRPTPIYHSDLKLENIFVGEDFLVKIGDFGLAVSMVTVSLREAGGTVSHVPPEAYRKFGRAAKVDKAWDIFTFGITLFELLSGKEPWQDLQSAVIIAHVTKGKRPDTKEISPAVPKYIVKIMKKCWDARPKKRPQFKDIASVITDIYKDYEEQLEECDNELKWVTSLDKLTDVKMEAMSESDFESKAVALCDYKKRGQVDIAFEKGDVIDVIEKTTSDWWMAKLRNERGFVSSSLVQTVDVGEWEKAFVIRDPVRLKNPYAIALTHTGFAVADKHAVLVYKKNGQFRFTLGESSDEADDSGDIRGTPSGVVDSQEARGTPSGVVDSQEPRGTPSGVVDSQEARDTPSGVVDSQEARVTPNGVVDSREARGTPNGVVDSREARGTPSGVVDSHEARGTPSGEVDSHEARGTPSGVVDSREARVTPSGVVDSHEARVTPSGVVDSQEPRGIPSGVAFTSGAFYVTMTVDSNSAYVRHYSANDGRYCGKWLSVDINGRPSEGAKLKGICTYDSRILVGEYMTKYVSTHNLDGSHVRSFEVNIKPIYLAATEESVIISDCYSKRIQLVTGFGQLLKEIQHPDMGNPLGVCYCSGVCLTCNGVIYVCDSREPKLFCFTQFGTYISSILLEPKEPEDGWGGIKYVAVDEGAKNLFVARGDTFHEPNGGRVEVYTRKQ